MIDNKKLFVDISYRFDDLGLLKDALTHTNNSKKKNLKFQRLEFLGDRIPGLVIADILFHKFANESEGDLTRRMHTLVNEETLAKIAKEINIGEHIILSYNEEKAGGRDKNTILADTLEAIIAAIYLDKGHTFVFEFVSVIRSRAKFVNSKQDISLLLIRDLSSNADLYSKSNFPI